MVVFAHSRPKCVAFWARESKKDMKKKTSFLFHILFSFLAPIVAFGNAYFNYTYSGFDY